MSNENWMPIPVAPGYSVSDLGRIRSEARETPRKNGGVYPVKEKIIKTPPGTDGYPRFNASVNGVVIELRVHQCVMLAFDGPPPEGQEVRHKNGIRSDCRRENLEYGTRSQNIDDAKRHGTFPVLERRPGAKLTKEKVIEIVKSDDTAAAIADRFGISIVAVQQIRNGTTWASVTEGLRKADYRKRGEGLGNAKLTEDLVRWIYSAPGSKRVIARKAGVNGKTVFSIKNGLTWQHVTGHQINGRHPTPVPGPDTVVGGATDGGPVTQDDLDNLAAGVVVPAEDGL
jgi:hypothetical protein